MNIRHFSSRRKRLLLLGTVLAALAVGVPLALAATSYSGAITSGDPTQTNRLFRGGVASTCGVPNSASIGNNGTYHYDQYTLQNNTASTQCVTATLATQCIAANFIFGASYVPSFNPASITANNVGDPGNSPNGAPVTWAFNVPAGSTFVIVVSEVTANAGCPAYTLTVDSGVPTAVTVTGVTATRHGGSVVVRWRAGSEATTLGYNVFREVAGNRVQVNPRLIPAPAKAGLHLYAYADHAVSASGTARYWLQQVATNGSRTWRGPISVRS